MTRKDYIKFATLFSEVKRYIRIREEQKTEYPPAHEKHYIVGLIEDRICDIFTQDNPRFNREKFLKACNS